MKISKLLYLVISLSFLVGCTEKDAQVEVSSVSLNTATIEMVEGETFTLVATVLPKDAEYDGVIWASSNASVASVNSGTVTAIKEGTATITASAGGKSSTCTVKVSAKVVAVTSIILDKTSLSMKVGETETITATVNPDNATDKIITWGSSDVSIATVADGKVSAKKSGIVTITAKSGYCIAECIVSVLAEVEYVTLDKASLSLAVGETAQLIATVKPDDATDKTVTWTSSDESIAKVIDGNVAAVKAGKATVTAECGGKTAECLVTVIVPVTGVSLDKTSLSLTKGGSAQLSAVVSPSNASNKNIIWSSSDSDIVTVNQSGLIQGIRGGNATISVQTEDGGFKAHCAVTVPVNVTGVTISKTSLSMIQGDTYTLSASIQPSDATNKDLVWSSDDTSIATVTSSGMVTAIGGGNTKITVKSSDGGYQDYCNVSVTIDPHQAVDLGLSVKWSKFNFGASSSTEVGGYYLWGDPTGTAVIMEYSAPSLIDISGTDYDIVRKGWGGNWRLPTKREVSELYDKCKLEAVTLNGTAGYKVIGPNGNSIFMPATGYAYPASGPIGRTKTTDTSSLYIMTGQSYSDGYARMAYIFCLKSNLSYSLPSWNADFAKFPVRGVR